LAFSDLRRQLPFRYYSCDVSDENAPNSDRFRETGNVPFSDSFWPIGDDRRLAAGQGSQVDPVQTFAAARKVGNSVEK